MWGGMSQKGQPQPLTPAKVAELRLTLPEVSMEACFQPSECQRLFFLLPGANPTAFLIMTLGINFAFIELSTFYIQSLC